LCQGTIYIIVKRDKAAEQSHTSRAGAAALLPPLCFLKLLLL